MWSYKLPVLIQQASSYSALPTYIDRLFVPPIQLITDERDCVMVMVKVKVWTLAIAPLT